MTSDDLSVVREPVNWMLGYGRIGSLEAIAEQLYGGAWACADPGWVLPDWLLDHQRVSASRAAGTLQTFNGAILADAVGLGKTYVALAVATRYRRVVVSVPATLKTQWQTAAESVGVKMSVVSHESLSRGAKLPAGDLFVIDEAHWFRNPGTRRYDSLARGLRGAPVLLVTATPVVNRADDLVHLLRLFLPDNGLRSVGLAGIDDQPDVEALANAAAAVTVSGSDRLAPVALPRVRDTTHRRSTLADDMESDALALLNRLHFPNFGGAGVRHLLRNHMLLRLASSAEALAETARGHIRYLREVRRNGTGCNTTRAVVRMLCNNHDDTQLDFLSQLSLAAPASPDPGLIEKEEDLLRRIVRLVDGAGPDPKRELLREVLADSAGSKTIVFTGATATAHSLASGIGWRRTAVVTGRGSRISSGRISLDEVLDTFSPRSRGAADPSLALDVDTLIATDLASEGLNLQDAGSLVHYDLPWNPVRLQQRLGRIRRIGSLHPDVAVTWFLPSERLEAALELPSLIERKALEQVRFGVPATATVGRSLRYNHVLEQRQSLCDRGRPGDVPAGHLVVRGSGAVISLRWQLGRSCMFETVAITPAGATIDPFAVGALIEELHHAEVVAEPVPGWIHRYILAHVRKRIRLLQRTPPVHRRLRRQVLIRARKAAKSRDLTLLRVLDRVLDVLQAGIPIGAERDIADWLEGREKCPEVALNASISVPCDFHGVTIVAALFGNKFV